MGGHHPSPALMTLVPRTVPPPAGPSPEILPPQPKRELLLQAGRYPGALLLSQYPACSLVVSRALPLPPIALPTTLPSLPPGCALLRTFVLAAPFPYMPCL